MTDHTWKKWEIIGLLFTLAAGNLLHFVYEWSGKNILVAAFSAVNESTWEHMKLLAVPWILWTVVQALVLRRSKVPVLAGRAAGLLVGLVSIPLLYYGYTGVTGQNVSLVNILIFQLAVLLAFGVSWYVQDRRWFHAPAWQIAGGLVLVSLAVLFVWWTYQTPTLPIFTDPTTGIRGIAE